MKTIGIFTTDEITALRASSDIICKYKISESEVTKHIRTKSNLYVEFSDGTYLNWIRPNTNSRGQKVTDAYIDISTCSLEAIPTIILPLIVNIERKPEIVIIDNNPDYEDYDLDTIIDRLQKIRYIKGNLQSVGYYDEEYGWQTIKGINVASDNSISFESPI